MKRNSGTRIYRYIAAVMMGAAIVSGSILKGGTQEAPSALPLPIWKPMPRTLRYLARPTRVWKYTMQPPAGYTPRQTQQTRLLAYNWHGQAAKTGVTPNVSLALAPTPMRNGKPYTAEQLVASVLAALKRGHDAWTQTLVEQGQINGIAFARAYWTGTERQLKRKLRGVAYMAVDGPTIISLQSQDIAPDKPDDAKTGAADAAPDTLNPNANAAAPDAANADGMPENIDRLRLAETAMQTFRRYAAPKPAPAAPPVAP